MKKLLFVPLPGVIRHLCKARMHHGHFSNFLFVIFIVVLASTSLMAQTTYLPNYLLKSYNTTSEYVNCQIYDDGNNVGINTATPGEKLDVNGGNIRTTGRFISLALGGIPPMTVNSATLVDNLNSDLLDGMHASAFSTTGHGHSNMLTGTGITSQVAFWSAGGVLSGEDALFWDFSTNRLGIGMDAPEAELHLYNANSECSMYISERHPGPHNGALVDSKWAISNQAGVLKFNYFDQITPVNILKITGGSISGLVEVNGTLKSSRLILTVGAHNNYLLTSLSSGATVWKDPALVTGWTVAGSDVVKNAGHVGIGTTLFPAKLNIASSDVPGIILDVAPGTEWGYGVLARVHSPDIAAFAVEQSGEPTVMIWGDGRICASKVKIKVPVFPDYVFRPNYDLLTIAELEAYLKEHQHLPDFPSASMVEQNGLDLGEMNTLLVEKVEEMTLYIIALYNENVAIQARLNALEKKNKKDKKR